MSLSRQKKRILLYNSSSRGNTFQSHLEDRVAVTLAEQLCRIFEHDWSEEIDYDLRTQTRTCRRCLHKRIRAVLPYPVPGSYKIGEGVYLSETYT